MTHDGTAALTLPTGPDAEVLAERYAGPDVPFSTCVGVDTEICSTRDSGADLNAVRAAHASDGTHVREPHEAASPHHAQLLFPHLERLDLLLQREVHRLDLDPDDRLRLGALMTSSDNVHDRLLAPIGAPDWTSEATDTCPPSPEARGRLAQLVARFGLSDLERDILLLSLMPRLDRRYAALFAYVQPHKPNQDWPTLELAMRLLGISASQRLLELGRLGSQAPLFLNGLVADASGKQRDDVPQSLLADISVCAFLIGGEPPKPPLCAQWLQNMPAGETAMGMAGDALRCGLVEVWAGCQDGGPIVTLRGAEGSGRAAALQHAAALVSRRVLQVRLNELPEVDGNAWSTLQTVLRDARIWDAILIISDADECLAARPALFAAFSRCIDTHPCPVALVMTTDAPLTWMEGHSGTRTHLFFDMPHRTLAADKRVMCESVRTHFPDHTISDDDLHEVAQRFRPSARVLGVVLAEITQYRRARACEMPIDKAQLSSALALRSQRHFGNLAQRVTPTRGFSDVILPKDTERQIREVMAVIRNRDTTLEKGFDRKLGRHTGVSALFYGSSGTGKTLAAEALAYELGVDLIKIDLSTVVNKYIGETEKNLSRIFDLAARDAGVLFFDEADALFGKRSETKDAHDRHANIEVSYLLQRLENYAGLVVLSTNHREHLDEAFTRRITFMVEFTLPRAAIQERMWRAIWPVQVRLSPEVDFSTLAARADLPGGNIRNIAWLASCFAEEEETDAVCWHHIDRAISLEYKKLGRIRW